MTWNQLEGQWKQATGALRLAWGELTNDELLVARGRRDMLAGRLQESYGIAGEQAERQAASFPEWFRANVGPAGSARRPNPIKRKWGRARTEKVLPARHDPAR